MKKTKQEKDYHAYLAQQPCVACGGTPVYIHHLRNINGINAGIGQRSSHYLCIPLCHSCHQGEDSIHHNRKIFEMRNGTETDLLAKTIENFWDGR